LRNQSTSCFATELHNQYRNRVAVVENAGDQVEHLRFSIKLSANAKTPMSEEDAELEMNFTYLWIKQ